MTSTKVCRACDKEKPCVDFYKKGLLVSGLPRYRPDCIACTIAILDADPSERERVRAATAEWRADDPERGRSSSRRSWAKHAEPRNVVRRQERLDPEIRPELLAQQRASYQRNREQRIADYRSSRLSSNLRKRLLEEEAG